MNHNYSKLIGFFFKGGVGNSAYAKRQFRPQLLSKAAEKSSGIPGEEVYLELELKLIGESNKDL